MGKIRNYLRAVRHRQQVIRTEGSHDDDEQRENHGRNGVDIDRAVHALPAERKAVEGRNIERYERQEIQQTREGPGKDHVHSK